MSMREARRSRIATLTLAAGCGPSTGAPQGDDGSSSGVVATTETSAAASSPEESTSADVTSTPADTSSSGALDESTGAALQCPHGGSAQLSTSHYIDVSAWPSDERGTTWTVVTDCTFVELTLDDAANWHFSCVHPVEPSVELVLRLGCFFTTCDLAIAPGDSVHLETYLVINGPPRNPMEERWTVLRDAGSELLFIGVAAHRVDFPGGPATTAPLSFELAPLGSCEPDFECGDNEELPIIVSAGADSEVIYDSSVAVLDLDGRSYSAAAEASCWREDYGYGGTFVIIPEP